jgi:hypothetical protein
MIEESECLSMNSSLHENIINNEIKTKNNIFFFKKNLNKYCCYNCSEDCLLWWFFHSTIGVERVIETKNVICCSYLDCCTGCLELNCKENIFCHKDQVCLLGCCTCTFV